MPTAMLTLFEISTTEGWTDVMFEAIDAAGIDMQPIRNNSALGWIVFFIFFMLFGGFFVVNLFVGVLLANFEQKRQQVQTDPHVKEDKAEAEWVTFEGDAICAAARASRRGVAAEAELELDASASRGGGGGGGAPPAADPARSTRASAGAASTRPRGRSPRSPTTRRRGRVARVLRADVCRRARSRCSSSRASRSTRS